MNKYKIWQWIWTIVDNKAVNFRVIKIQIIISEWDYESNSDDTEVIYFWSSIASSYKEDSKKITAKEFNCKETKEELFNLL